MSRIIPVTYHSLACHISVDPELIEPQFQSHSASLKHLDHSFRLIPLQRRIQCLTHLAHPLHTYSHDTHYFLWREWCAACFGQDAELALRVESEGECAG